MSRAAAGGASLEAVERNHILAVLQRTRWVIDGAGGAARLLGLHPNTLRSRMKKLGIVRPGDPSLISIFLLAMVKEALYQQIIGTRSFSVGRVVTEIFECLQRGVLLVRLPE